MIRNMMSGSTPIRPVAATQPTIGGNAPAAPPMTMFCGVALQQDRIHDDVEDDRERQQSRRRDIDRKPHHDNGARRKHEPEGERFRSRHSATRDRTHCGTGHYCIYVGVVPHVEHARSAGARRDGEEGDKADKRIEPTRRNQ
jgi:hypothetical protein